MAVDLVIVARVLTFILLLVQGAILNAFLIDGRSSSNYAWIVVDVLVLVVWMALMIDPKLHKRIAAALRLFGRDETDHAAQHQELHTMWLPWLLYTAVSLAPRVAVIYYVIAPDLKVDPFLGTNLLKFSVALTAAIFLSLVNAHVGPEAYTYYKYFLERMQTGVVLDIFDSGEFLAVFFTEGQRGADNEEFVFTSPLKIAVIIFAVVNLITPTVALVEIEKKRKKQFKYTIGTQRWSNAKLVYLYLNTFVVNLPFAVLRVILWVRHDKEISVLLVKNIIFIVMNALDISEYYGEERPLRCAKCRLMYPGSRLEKHARGCSSARAASTASSAVLAPAVDNAEATELDIIVRPGHASGYDCS